MSIDSSADLNGDGVPDIVVADNLSIYVYSGADQSLIYKKSMPAVGDTWYWVASVGDWDGDGYDDFAGVGHSPDIFIYSGKTGEMIGKISREKNASGNSVIVGAKDYNGSPGGAVLETASQIVNFDLAGNVDYSTSGGKVSLYRVKSN